MLEDKSRQNKLCEMCRKPLPVNQPILACKSCSEELRTAISRTTKKAKTKKKS